MPFGFVFTIQKEAKLPSVSLADAAHGREAATQFASVVCGRSDWVVF